MIRFRGVWIVIFTASCFFCVSCGTKGKNAAFLTSPYDLHFDEPADRWDEGIPLGNGILGALIWQKGGRLRLALDRIDLWDLRLQEEMHRPEHNFQKLYSLWKNGEYEKAREFRDLLRKYPFPTKIPGGALEFELPALGDVKSVHLYILPAVCEVVWNNGIKLQVFIHAKDRIGRFRIWNAPEKFKPVLVPPAYQSEQIDSEVRDQNRGSLLRLNYPSPELSEGADFCSYHQETTLGNSYDIDVRWSRTGERVIDGVWAIFWNEAGKEPAARSRIDKGLERGFDRDLSAHLDWWSGFWGKSEVSVPDQVILTQWYREMYKFGSCTGIGTVPISLQSVWTADNGSLPPWAGDFHHDLNTQLSYWPAYSGNHLREARVFVDWLWEVKREAENYTRTFFQSQGLAFPGVTDIKGRAMGGWWQYSHNPTIAAWLGHHFYLQWRYSFDHEFLESRAYPWIRDCANFFTDFSEFDSDGKRSLPLSSTPEINDDRADAWFPETTNFDLALIRWTYLKAAELAAELGLTDQAAHWRRLLSEWPELSLAGDDGRLLVAPEYPLPNSHRHFSHLMAIHPLGLLDIGRGGEDAKIITASLEELDRLGTQNWVGYSFSWLASLKARNGDGTGAAEALRIFADSFCSPNSFHLNGDQSGKGYSRYTYRPFTLEGNFAYAAGLMEMLLQSHSGLIRIFPAVPENWETISFSGLRAEGAFLVSASKRDGRIMRVRIRSEKGGVLKLLNPFAANEVKISGISRSRILLKEGILQVDMNPGEMIILAE